MTAVDQAKFNRGLALIMGGGMRIALPREAKAAAIRYLMETVNALGSAQLAELEGDPRVPQRNGTPTVGTRLSQPIVSRANQSPPAVPARPMALPRVDNVIVPAEGSASARRDWAQEDARRREKERISRGLQIEAERRAKEEKEERDFAAASAEWTRASNESWARTFGMIGLESPEALCQMNSQEQDEYVRHLREAAAEAGEWRRALVVQEEYIEACRGRVPRGQRLTLAIMRKVAREFEARSALPRGEDGFVIRGSSPRMLESALALAGAASS